MLKKILMALCISLLLCGCQKEEEKENTQTNNAVVENNTINDNDTARDDGENTGEDDLDFGSNELPLDDFD